MSEGAVSANGWSDWDRFLESLPDSGFMQSSWWAEFRLDAGYEHFGVVLKDRGAVVGGAIVMRYEHAPGRCFYYVPDGPVIPSDDEGGGEIFEAILEEIEERRRSDPLTVTHLRIEPRWRRLPEFVKGFHPVSQFVDIYVEPRSTLCVDLRLSEDEILAGMKPKGRYNVRLAQRHGVTVVEDASEQGIADFLDIYHATASRQGMKPKPDSYFRTMLSVLSPVGRGTIYFAEHRGVRLAAVLIVTFGSTATYFFGGSRNEHREVMAPYLLHFEAMRKAKAAGCSWYDFWGVAPDDNPDHPWADFSVFKRKFGGVESRLVPTLDYDYAAVTSA